MTCRWRIARVAAAGTGFSRIAIIHAFLLRVFTSCALCTDRRVIGCDPSRGCGLSRDCWAAGACNTQEGRTWWSTGARGIRESKRRLRREKVERDKMIQPRLTRWEPEVGGCIVSNANLSTCQTSKLALECGISCSIHTAIDPSKYVSMGCIELLVVCGCFATRHTYMRRR